MIEKDRLHSRDGLLGPLAVRRRISRQRLEPRGVRAMTVRAVTVLCGTTGVEVRGFRVGWMANGSKGVQGVQDGVGLVEGEVAGGQGGGRVRAVAQEAGQADGSGGGRDG